MRPSKKLVQLQQRINALTLQVASLEKENATLKSETKTLASKSKTLETELSNQKNSSRRRRKRVETIAPKGE